MTFKALNQETMEALYRETLSAPLQALAESAVQTSDRLEALSSGKKPLLRAATRSLAAHLPGSNAFVPPDTLAAFSSIARNVLALQSGLEKTTCGGNALTHGERAVMLHPHTQIAQLAQSAGVLRDALSEMGEAALAADAGTVAMHAEQVQSALTHSSARSLLTEAGEQTSGVRRQTLASRESFRRQAFRPSHEHIVEAPFHALSEDLDLFAQHAKTLNEKDRQRIGAAVTACRQQMGVSAHYGDLVRSVIAIADRASLKSTQPAPGFERLRDAARVLGTALGTINADGKYDGLASAAAGINAHSSALLEALRTPRAEVMTFETAGSPPTRVSNPSAVALDAPDRSRLR